MNPPASPFVSPGHWVYRILRQLDHAGVLPRGADVARQSIPQEEIAALLAAADSVAGTTFLQQFRAEHRAPRGQGASFLERRLETRFHASRNQFAPGIGYDSLNWAGARALDDETDWLYGLRLSGALAPHFAGLVEASSKSDDWELQLTGTAGYLGAWAGRRRIGYGVGHGGGLVLNAHPLPGAGLYLARPLALPLLGPVRFEMHFSQIDNVLNLNNTQRAIEPWFWTARGSFEPFESLRIGINRGMMFGGEGNVPVTFARVARNMIGVYTGEDENSFANQVLSVDFRLRVPGLPMAAYLEWGSDDAAGGWWDVPGILAGLEYVFVDSSFDVAVGAEHVQFSGSCCGNSIWYRNAWFRGSWADDTDMLGHPLGGHGREWRVFTNGSLRGGSTGAHAALFVRDRRAENILTPAWRGKSTGLQGGADVPLARTIRIKMAGEIEWGASDWTAGRLSVALRSHF